MDKELLLVEMNGELALCIAPAYRVGEGDLVEADGKIGKVLMAASVKYGSEPLYALMKKFIGSTPIHEVSTIYYESKVVNVEGEETR